ncbi:MAG: hypothetical protein IJX26_01190 [Clostridia bacterium]|nr:hypothetical protein [Clostridia bacterium]
MTTILEIQKLDAEKRKIQASVNNSKESKLLQQFTNVMKEGKTFVTNIAKAAGEMIAEYNTIKNQFDNLSAKAEITAKQKAEQSNLESLNDLVKSSNSLASDFAIMEQRMKDLTDKSTKLLNDYNTAMNQLKNTRQKVDTLKEMIAKMQEGIAGNLTELDNKIKALEPNVDAEVYKIYRKMTSDNIFPVFVKLNGNKCGGCQMELPLSFVERLKAKGRLACEECQRIILYSDKK